MRARLLCLVVLSGALLGPRAAEACKLAFPQAHLSDETRKKIESLAAAEGARLVKSENTVETLEDVFLRTVQESGDGLTYKKPAEKKE